MLPIIQAAPNSWTLDKTVAISWDGHVKFFTDILSTWRLNLATVPMSVDYVPNI